MQHLTPVGLSEDGTELVLAGPSGEEFAVAVDQRLRAALRGDRARAGQGEMTMESALRPRDIQARIRAGESAEDVAAAAQTTLEAIMPFAAPVLAERAHVAQTALKSSIRRTTTETSPVARTLDEASRQYLTALAVRADDVEWDAWRRDDGRWSLVAEYIAGDDVHRAEFTYDQPGRYVLAENDQARLLTGEAAAAAPQEPSGRRLSAVPTVSFGDELPLGDDAIELVREVPAETPAARADVEPPASERPATEPTTDLSETAQAVRTTAPQVQGSIDDLAADHADADWISSTVPPPVERHEPPAPTAEEPEATPEDETPARKKGRSSVPSWDEIMFGGGKSD